MSHAKTSITNTQTYGCTCCGVIWSENADHENVGDMTIFDLLQLELDDD